MLRFELLSGPCTSNVLTSPYSSRILHRCYGRSPAYLYRTLSSAVAVIPIGILGFFAASNGVNNASAGLMIFNNFTFHMSIGPACYTIVGEMPSSRLRVRSIAFGRFIYVVNGIITSSINPYLVKYLAAKAGRSGLLRASHASSGVSFDSQRPAALLLPSSTFSLPTRCRRGGLLLPTSLTSSRKVLTSRLMKNLHLCSSSKSSAFLR